MISRLGLKFISNNHFPLVRSQFEARQTNHHGPKHSAESSVRQMLWLSQIVWLRSVSRPQSLHAKSEHRFLWSSNRLLISLRFFLKRPLSSNDQSTCILKVETTLSFESAMRHHPKLQQRPWTNTPLTFVLHRNKQINVPCNCHCRFKLSVVRDEFGMTFRHRPIITFRNKGTVTVCHQNQAESAVYALFVF